MLKKISSCAITATVLSLVCCFSTGCSQLNNGSSNSKTYVHQFNPDDHTAEYVALVKVFLNTLV